MEICAWKTRNSLTWFANLFIQILNAQSCIDRWPSPSSAMTPGPSSSWTRTATRSDCWKPSTRSATREETQKQVGAARTQRAGCWETVYIVMYASKKTNVCSCCDWEYKHLKCIKKTNAYMCLCLTNLLPDADTFGLTAS